MSLSRKAYSSDVSDDEWALVAPYLTLVREDDPLRQSVERPFQITQQAAKAQSCYGVRADISC